MAEPIKTFVVLDAGVNQSEVERALPNGDDVEIVGLVNGIDDAWVRLHETSNDLLVVACAGQSEAALTLIDNAVTERPRRPVVVLAYGSPNGFTNRVFAAGADDVVMLPVTPDEVLFTLQKAIARKAGGADSAGFSRAPLDLRARAERRHREDAHVDQPRGRARRVREDRRPRRPRPPVRRRRPHHGADARRRRSSTSCARAARSTRRSSTGS